MPRLSKDFKHAIEDIPVCELQKLVMQEAAKNREFYDIINIQYISGKQAEKEIFEDVKEKVLGEIFYTDDRGILQKNLAQAISKAVKHINYYVRSQNCLGYSRYSSIRSSKSYEEPFLLGYPNLQSVLLVRMSS